MKHSQQYLRGTTAGALRAWADRVERGEFMARRLESIVADADDGGIHVVAIELPDALFPAPGGTYA